jgi:hypothetical protein
MGLPVGRVSRTTWSRRRDEAETVDVISSCCGLSPHQKGSGFRQRSGQSDDSAYGSLKAGIRVGDAILERSVSSIYEMWQAWKGVWKYPDVIPSYG